MNQSEIIRQSYYDGVVIKDLETLTDNIKKIESLFRNSKEYKAYIASIKEGLQIKNCAFFMDKDFTDVDLELHHVLPQLYDIVLIVGGKLITELKDSEFLTIYDIVSETIKFHMKDYPMVMLLSTTLHQLYHTGQYALPTNSKSFHAGKFLEFIKEYSSFLSQEDIDTMKLFLPPKDSEKVDILWKEINKN